MILHLKTKKSEFQYDNADFQEFLKFAKPTELNVIPIEMPGSNENQELHSHILIQSILPTIRN